jgi:hypothetical protein
MNKPTIKFKRKLLASKILENKGKVGKSMRKLGYSKSYSKNPQLVTRSKSWQSLMDKYLPEDKIAKTHGELLEAERPVICDKEVSMYPDNDARLRAIDLTYKMRGRYAPEKIEDVTPYAGLSNAELLAKEKELTAKILARKLKK